MVARDFTPISFYKTQVPKLEVINFKQYLNAMELIAFILYSGNEVATNEA